MVILGIVSCEIIQFFEVSSFVMKTDYLAFLRTKVSIGNIRSVWCDQEKSELIVFKAHITKIGIHFVTFTSKFT